MSKDDIDWNARNSQGQRSPRVVTPDGFHGRAVGGPGSGGRTMVAVDAPGGGHTCHTYRTADLTKE